MPEHAMAKTFAGSVTVGERGQVVIPAEAREQLDIQPGEKLLVFIHPGGGGLFFTRLGELRRFTEALAPIIKAHEAKEGRQGEDGE